MSERASGEPWFQTLLEAAPDAIVVSDGAGRIMLVNGQAERMLGYARAELEGKPVDLLLPEGARSAHARQRAAYAAHPSTRPMGAARELACRRRDGSEFPAEISLSPLATPEGLVVISIIRDTSAARRAQAERQQLLLRTQAACAEAEAANRSKDQFLAIISHELRAPLQAILGWTEHLRQSEVERELLDRGLDIIERSVKMQASLVTDLLDVARVAAGKFRLHVRALELAPVVEAAAEVVRTSANAKGIRLETTLEPATVLGDPDRLQQVVWNLVSNAVKFTPDGGRVTVALTTSGARVQLTVHDTGRGIRRDFLAYVFERFTQSDDFTTREHGGLGLGLAIVRHIVELHAGSVRVASDGEGQGATFTIELPRLETRRGREASEM